MVKGEDYRYGGWYYFDPVTGEMAKGFRFVDSNGGKWVFYDYTTGQMAHGERYIDGSHGDEPGWMYFDDSTGAVLYGWRFLMSDVDFKWVYYDTSTGRMVHGSRVIDGVPREFDMATGAHLFGGRYSPDEAREVLDLVNQARAAVGVERRLCGTTSSERWRRGPRCRAHDPVLPYAPLTDLPAWPSSPDASRRREHRRRPEVCGGGE